MKPSQVRKTRLLLICLLGITVGAIGWNYLNRNGRRTTSKPDVRLLNSDVLKSTQQVEYVETEGGRVVFKISAEKYIQTVDGKSLLEGVRALGYGEDGSRKDSIESQNCQYDPNSHDVAFQGQVIIRTQEGVVIETESVSYSKSTGIAQTQDRFSFRHGEFTGGGLGFVYPFKKGLIQIRQDAAFELNTRPDSKESDSSPIEIRSATANIYRDYRFNFLGHAEILQGASRLSADEIRIRVDDEGNFIQTLEAHGNAEMNLPLSGESRTIGGNLLFLKFSEGTNLLDSVRAEEQAYFGMRGSAEGESRLTAKRIDLSVDASGSPRQLTASDDAEFRRTTPRDLLWMQGGALSLSFSPDGSSRTLRFGKPNQMRMLRGDQLLELWSSDLTAGFREDDNRLAMNHVSALDGTLGKSQDETFLKLDFPGLRQLQREPTGTLRCRNLEMQFVVDGQQLQMIQGSDGCWLRDVISRNEQTGNRVLHAKNMRFRFYDGTTSLKDLEADTGVEIQEEIGEGKRTARSDTLTAKFDRESGELIDIMQKGSFRLNQNQLRATGERAEYDVPSSRLRLEGNPHVWNGSTETRSRIVEVLDDGNQVSAIGNVLSISRGTGNQSDVEGLFGGAGTRDQVFLITSASMALDRGKRVARYVGEAKASQGFDYLSADTIRLDQKKQELLALGNVQTHFLGPPRSKEISATPFHASSARMKFKRNDRYMEFMEKVVVTFGDLTLESSKLNVFFDPEIRAVERMTAREGVRLAKGVWRGRGQEGEYRVAEDVVILRGNLAEIWDNTHRRSAGRQLTFYKASDRILVESRP